LLSTHSNIGHLLFINEAKKATTNHFGNIIALLKF